MQTYAATSQIGSRRSFASKTLATVVGAALALSVATGVGVQIGRDLERPASAPAPAATTQTHRFVFARWGGAVYSTAANQPTASTTFDTVAPVAVTAKTRMVGWRLTPPSAQ